MVLAQRRRRRRRGKTRQEGSSLTIPTLNTPTLILTTVFLSGDTILSMFWDHKGCVPLTWPVRLAPCFALTLKQVLFLFLVAPRRFWVWRSVWGRSSRIFVVFSMLVSSLTTPAPQLRTFLSLSLSLSLSSLFFFLSLSFWMRKMKKKMIVKWMSHIEWFSLQDVHFIQCWYYI